MIAMRTMDTVILTVHFQRTNFSPLGRCVYIEQEGKTAFVSETVFFIFCIINLQR